MSLPKGKDKGTGHRAQGTGHKAKTKKTYPLPIPCTLRLEPFLLAKPLTLDLSNRTNFPLLK
jgi:hypothetical protein